MENRIKGGFWKNIGACADTKVVRTIHPVGQGAMYSESFIVCNKTKFVALYDCGSYNGAALEKALETVGNVDCLFISHFHHDHISGVSKLIAEHKVKKIFIPYVTPSQFFLDLVHNVLVAGHDYVHDTSIGFMFSVLPYLSGADLENPLPADVAVVKPSDVFDRQYVADGTVSWYYDVLTSTITDRGEDELIGSILNLLPMSLESGMDEFQSKTWYENLLKELNGKLGEIRKLYRNAFPGGHNSYSMIVYSHKNEAFYGSKTPGLHTFDCVYTGDAEMSADIVGKIRDCAPEYIQVPHHGSCKNYDPRIYHRHQTAFISAGENNRYHHPSLHTLNEIINTCAETHIVTEKGQAYVKEYVLI